MATLYITEFFGCGSNERGGLNPIAMTPSAADQAIAIAGASAQSALLNAATSMVRLTTDANCSVKFGTNPIAAVTTMRLAAGSVEYFGVTPGSMLKVAVIANA